MGKGYKKTFELDEGIPIVCTVKDATATIQMWRKLADFTNGVRAAPRYCVDHNCVMRNAKANPELFPHPVLAVWFIKSRTYILTHLHKSGPKRGQGEVIRYAHDDAEFINRFDKGLHIHEKERMITLAPLTGRSRIGHNGGMGGGHAPGRPNVPAAKPRRMSIHRGLGARAKTLGKWMAEQAAKKAAATA